MSPCFLFLFKQIKITKRAFFFWVSDVCRHFLSFCIRHQRDWFRFFYFSNHLEFENEEFFLSDCECNQNFQFNVEESNIDSLKKRKKSFIPKKKNEEWFKVITNQELFTLLPCFIAVDIKPKKKNQIQNKVLGKFCFFSLKGASGYNRNINQ